MSQQTRNHSKHLVRNQMGRGEERVRLDDALSELHAGVLREGPSAASSCRLRPTGPLVSVDRNSGQVGAGSYRTGPRGSTVKYSKKNFFLTSTFYFGTVLNS